jgi:hypothetical protein
MVRVWVIRGRGRKWCERLDELKRKRKRTKKGEDQTDAKRKQ